MIRCNPSLSLSFNHHSYLFNTTFEHNPLLISSPKCTCCCCCCYCYAANTSLSNKLSTINPRFICSQLSFSKRVVFYGNTFGSSAFNVLDRSYYYKKISDVMERSKYGKKGFVQKRKKQILSCNASDGYVDDVEVMLSLLTNEVDLECIGFKDGKKITKKRTCGDEVVKVKSLTRNENLDLRNEGSCGRLEGDKDFEVECGGYVGQTSSTDKKDLGEDHKVCIHEIVDNIGKPSECVEEQGKLLEKKDTVKGNYGDLVGVSQDYRKKSEKKLNEKFSQHESNVSLNIGEECRQHSHEVDKISDDSGSDMKYKRFADKGKSVIELNSSTEKKLKVISEVSKSQEIGKRGTPSLSESRIKSFEEKSTEVKDQIKDNRDEHLKKYEKSQQIIGISDTHFSNRNAEGDAKVTKTSIEGNDSGPGMISVEEGSRPKGGGSRHSSQGSGPKGPSDEMWHVTDASTSTQDPSEPDTQDNMSDISESGEPAKPSGRSLWTIIGDMVSLNWKSPRSESHTPNSRDAKASSYMSASSENWFSSHDPDDSNDENVKKQITRGLDSPLADGPSKSISLPIITESPFPLPATQMTRSPATKKTKNNGELKRWRLEPKDQVTKHNFDEWEEAYDIEAKQRKIDEMFMTEALLEAKKAADVWEVPVGAVLVKDGKIIARGYNLVEELRDSTAHAEMICIRKASTNLRSWRLIDTTLYVTLEPCPMCAGAILQARIDTIVWGAPNKLLGADGSWVRLFCDGDGGNGSQPTDKPPAPQHPFHPNMVVRRGVLAAECAEIMQNFFRLRRIKKREPEPVTLLSSITVSHHLHQSNFFSKVQHAFKIIFCL